MKKLFGIFLILSIYSSSISAQKFAYVDTDYILNSIPEYKAAQSELDKFSQDWQKEIESKKIELDKLNKAYQAEIILLTDELKKKRETEIDTKEKELRDLQKQRFGVEGDIFRKRMELMKPIQDKVYNAIKTYAEKAGFAIIFDKNSDITMLYTNPKYDKSEDILTNLGYNKSKK